MIGECDGVVSGGGGATRAGAEMREELRLDELGRMAGLQMLGEEGMLWRHAVLERYLYFAAAAVDPAARNQGKTQ